LQPLGTHPALSAFDERRYGGTTITLFQSLDAEAL
jgi:hypothetical protein